MFIKIKKSFTFMLMLSVFLMFNSNANATVSTVDNSTSSKESEQSSLSIQGLYEQIKENGLSSQIMESIGLVRSLLKIDIFNEQLASNVSDFSKQSSGLFQNVLSNIKSTSGSSSSSSSSSDTSDTSSDINGYISNLSTIADKYSSSLSAGGYDEAVSSVKELFTVPQNITAEEYQKHREVIGNIYTTANSELIALADTYASKIDPEESRKDASIKTATAPANVNTSLKTLSELNINSNVMNEFAVLINASMVKVISSGELMKNTNYVKEE